MYEVGWASSVCAYTHMNHYIDVIGRISSVMDVGYALISITDRKCCGGDGGYQTEMDDHASVPAAYCDAMAFPVFGTRFPTVAFLQVHGCRCGQEGLGNHGQEEDS